METWAIQTFCQRFMKATHIPMLSAIACVSILNGAIADPKIATQAVPRKGPQTALNLAIFIFDGVQIIDYTGPYETFGHVYSDTKPLFNIYTVAQKTGAITTAMGMSVNPKYTFDNAPSPDVLLIPGGHVDAEVNDHNVIKWIQDKTKNAVVTMSVCNGAFMLAKAGLLDGLEATTTFGLISKLREAAPNTKVVDNKRFVDNGRIVTAAGLSSGIDCSLHVIERLFGKGMAQMAALGMEYNWDPDSQFVRAALADKYMQFDYDVKVLDGGWMPLAREGGVDRWENKWAVTTESSDTELLESINRTITSNKRTLGPSQVRWIRQKDESVNPTRSLWHFTDENGNIWNGVVRVEPNAGKQNQFTLTVAVDRDKSFKSTREQTRGGTL
jgi:putative intracellular protease/amidase